MFHRSERLLLRPTFREDWQAIYRAINDAAIVRMLASAPWPYREQDARDFVSLPQRPRTPRFAVTLPGEQGAQLIGCIGIDPREDGAELGYWLARAHWGRGYTTEAGRAVIEIARMLGHIRLHAGHAVDNPASGKVLSKLGFQPTGEICRQPSKGRGEDVPVQRYVMELGSARLGDPEPQLKAA